MSQFTTALTMLGRHRALQALRPHARPLILACGLASALLVWAAPAPATRCMIVKQAALGWQGAMSLSIILTMLAWYGHKPVLQRVRAIRQRLSND